jgi:hypothetical protein
VLAVRVLPADKESLLAAEPPKFFITDHYRDYAAILAWLDKVDAREMRELLTDAWRCQAPRGLVKERDAWRASHKAVGPPTARSLKIAFPPCTRELS